MAIHVRQRSGNARKAARIYAWIAHADHADTFRLRQALFDGGWFEVIEGLEGR